VSGGFMVSAAIMHALLNPLVDSYSKRQDILRDTFICKTLNCSGILFSQWSIDAMIETYVWEKKWIVMKS
jgi:hypothetical protein